MELDSSKLCEFCIFCMFFFKLGDSGPEFLASLMILVNLVSLGDQIYVLGSIGIDFGSFLDTFVF